MTMKLVQTITVGVGGASSIDFINIPQTGTDLLVLLSGRVNWPSDETWYTNLRFNSSTTGYDYRSLHANGSSAAFSDNYAAQDGILVRTNGNTATTNVFGSASIYIPNYTSSVAKKVSIDSVSENNATTARQALKTGSWSGTAAITQLTLAGYSSSWLAGSTASLYTITKRDNSGTAKATGGTVTYSGGYAYHTFTSSGTFTPSQPLTADVLVIAGGGGGGGGNPGGGGGAGGLRALISQPISTSQSVTVGAGGSANGSPTSFGSIAVSGGGAGGFFGSAGSAGGSGGGGGGGGYGGGSGNSGGYTPVEGKAGGAGKSAPYPAGGGGGGAGGAGAGGDTTGNGGLGASDYNNISFSPWLAATGTGVSGIIAGGGGGGYVSSSATGGGGAGGANGTNGTANTGGGGGGASSVPGSGGSGLVIVRYMV